MSCYAMFTYAMCVMRVKNAVKMLDTNPMLCYVCYAMLIYAMCVMHVKNAVKMLSDALPEGPTLRNHRKNAFKAAVPFYA